MKEKTTLVTHKATGALIPVVIKGVDKTGIINDYKEYTHNRKGFRLQMLQDRWHMAKEDVLELLKRYQVPGYINHALMIATEEANSPADVAIFWEEYIYGIENKEKLLHTKLKSKILDKLIIN